MRWVCKDDIEECLSEEWRRTSEAALERLENAETVEERKAILRRGSSSNVWRDFYALLPESLKTKCWYCEAEEIRSDMPIDHFRPKQEVEEQTDHSGYWWLAFDWENYRCACTFCNSRRNMEETSGGKQNQFPLMQEEDRASSPDDNVDDEVPALLDPFDPDDEKLLWFDNDGKPEASPQCPAQLQCKVDNSINIFHLHETRIVRKRNKLRLSINTDVKDLRAALEAGDLARSRQLKSKLRKAVRNTEMLSRAAIVYLRQYRDRDEIKEILTLD
jgi:uncharacterized protein (TIGR02646 family)